MKRLYHYTSINTLALILSTRKIRFNRLDKVNDPMEGGSKDFGSFSKYMFASCWTNYEKENISMWNMYTPNMRGVRIELLLPLFNSEDEEHLLTKEECMNKEKGYYSDGGRQSPFEVEYTNDENKLCPNIWMKEGINTNLLGRYKDEIWSFEKEFRFLIHFFPNGKTGNVKKNDPPPIEFYDFKINDGSFKNMKIRLSPKILPGDKEIVISLIEKYNPKAEVSDSMLSGLIR